MVLAVIAALAALMLPALAGAKGRGRRVQCLNNLRQLGLAAEVYLLDQAASYPPAQYLDLVTGRAYAWDLTVGYNAQHQVVVTPGILWEGLGSAQIQQCPAFAGSANYADNPYTGYNYNTSFIGHGQGEDIETPAVAAEVRHPARTAIFGDGQYGAGADKFMRAPWPNPGDAGFVGRWGGTQGFRHQGRSNTAFCDGHAEPLDAVFTDNADGAANVARGTGFLSADNSLYQLD